MLSPLQSSRAVSWCRLASEELSTCWMPTRSLCGEDNVHNHWKIHLICCSTNNLTPTTLKDSSRGSVFVIPRLMGTEARQTAGDPGSGSAWWSGTSGRWSEAADEREKRGLTLMSRESKARFSTSSTTSWPNFQ